MPASPTRALNGSTHGHAAAAPEHPARAVSAKYSRGLSLLGWLQQLQLDQFHAKIVEEVRQGVGREPTPHFREPLLPSAYCLNRERPHGQQRLCSVPVSPAG